MPVLHGTSGQAACSNFTPTSRNNWHEVAEMKAAATQAKSEGGARLGGGMQDGCKRRSSKLLSRADLRPIALLPSCL